MNKMNNVLSVFLMKNFSYFLINRMVDTTFTEYKSTWMDHFGTPKIESKIAKDHIEKTQNRTLRLFNIHRKYRHDPIISVR